MDERKWLTSDKPREMVGYLFSLPTKPSMRKVRLAMVAACRGVWEFLTDPRTRMAVEAAEKHVDGECSVEELQRANEQAHRAATDANAGYYSLVWLGFFCSDTRAEYQMESLRECLCLPHDLNPGSGRAKADIIRGIFGNSFRPITLYKPHKLCVACVRESHMDCGYRVRSSGTRCGCKVCWGEDHCRVPSINWLTPMVISIAQEVYEKREEGCEVCGGSGRKAHWIPNRSYECPSCHGEKSWDSSLDPSRLAILADALVDAGCPENISCPHCAGRGKIKFMDWGPESGVWRRCDIYHKVPEDSPENCRGKGWLNIPHPILAHLRGDSPRYRGDWAIDALLGKK